MATTADYGDPTDPLSDPSLAEWAAAVAAALPPIGSVVAYGGTAAPAGWHLCDGTAHGSATLQAVIGSANTPDLRGRFIAGAGGSYTVGATGGADTVVLANANLENGFRYASAASNFQTAPGAGAGYAIDPAFEETGGGIAHENRPPYYALTYIIRKA